VDTVLLSSQFCLSELKMCGKQLQTPLDCDSHLASLPLVVSSRNRLSALYLWILAVPKKHSQIKSPYEKQAQSPPHRAPILSKDSSHIKLSSPSGTQSFTPSRVLPALNNKIYCVSAILRDKVWRACFVSCCGVLPTSRDFRR
jgi:hypothetical protein